MFGAKLSWCQIVHFYNFGAKLSAFIILVPNCPLYYLGAKLSGAKLSYNQGRGAGVWRPPKSDDVIYEQPLIKCKDDTNKLFMF